MALSPRAKSASTLAVGDCSPVPSPNPGLTIEYIGGSLATDGTLEGYRGLVGNYIMKGYMLRISTQPIQPGTLVTWEIKKGGNEVGTYHSSDAWAQYNQTIPKPQTSTILWRSDRGGSITDTYCIFATYTPQGGTQPVKALRQVQSRLLDPAVVSIRDNFNEDSDMVQRVMLQIFYINKGRLDSYRIGQYDTNHSHPTEKGGKKVELTR